MVKKKAAAKRAAKKAPPKKLGTSKARQDKARANARRAAKAPKNEQLELIKGVRYSDLDRLCRQIGDNRDELNELKTIGADLELAALKAMRVHGVTGYKNAGVLITIVPGDEKLSVKRDRDGKASDGGGALNQPDTGGETGSGQDAGEIANALTEGQGDEDQGGED